MAERTYRISVFALLAGVTVRALHHCDRLGLLKLGGYRPATRVYSAKDLETLEQIVALILSGVAIGALASSALTQFLARLLWGVSARDPWTIAAATAAMVTVGSAACFLPARRAAAIDPLVTLRTE